MFKAFIRFHCLKSKERKKDKKNTNKVNKKES